MTLHLPDGNLGVYAAMERLAQIIRDSPLVTRFDLGDTPDAWSPVGMGEHLDHLVRLIRRKVRYQPEPNEVIVWPTTLAFQARQGRAVGDCDDFVALLGAMLYNLGYTLKLVVTDQDHDGRWDHVAMAVHDPDTDTWIDVDPASEYAVGALAEGRHRLDIAV